MLLLNPEGGTVLVNLLQPS
uniref:Uncharacterized protein n=1 Tax=Anguilla anguilla TaxID=7936 RepID=A0A0E9UT80_ANGAN